MNVRRPFSYLLLAFLFPLVSVLDSQPLPAPSPQIFGFRDTAAELRIEDRFLAVPSAEMAGQELKTLTAEPHMAGTPEDYSTALYVAAKFRAAGLQTAIVPYRVLLDWPKKVQVEAWDAAGKHLMSGPTPEHLAADPAGDNPRVVMAFNGSSASGDVTAQVIYGNYCRLDDFNKLSQEHVDVRGKVVLCRYGANFRGVKVYLAQLRGAAGVLIYSDPQDDGYVKGDAWPMGPWRPATGVQRGSVQFLFKYPGDPETPGIASTPDLPASARSSPLGNQPSIVSIPLSYHDAAPILQALQGPGVPQGWQGGLPFPYHLGPGGVTVHLVSQQDSELRTIWDVVGTIPGSEDPDAWVITGNHRDAWVYGAADPSSGTAALLEAVRGVGVLLQHGWRPKRTIVFCSWDAEEQGLIGLTVWARPNAQALHRAVAYFNVDVGATGPNFTASSVPSLRAFVRGVTETVPSPLGGTVYDQWKLKQQGTGDHPTEVHEPQLGSLGSGSDYTPFLQHLGVPSTDVGSEGPYGVYHSAFDDFAWFKANADPHFLYLQEMARVLGLETVRMADADALPLDYVSYAHAVQIYLNAAQSKADAAGMSKLDFGAAQQADGRFLNAAQQVYAQQAAGSGDLNRLNTALRDAESALLNPQGLPNRPWYRHTIFAPGEYTGYAAVVLPGVNEAIEAHNETQAAQQLQALTQALDRAAQTLAAAR